MMKRKKQETKKTKILKYRLTSSFLAFLIALLAVASATYAWYIYNTSRRTTNVRMAAGAGGSLQISNSYDGVYGASAVMESFVGRLVPVSTNRITGGFQKATDFVEGNGNQAPMVAKGFGVGEEKDYYHTSLFLRTNGTDTGIYISDIGFEDSDENLPISSALRLGLVVHQPGKNAGVAGEYIFEISDKKNPMKEYNTATGQEGFVLDASKKDGTTVLSQTYTKAAYCNYNKETGVLTVGNALKLCTVSGNSGDYGTPVEIEIYIWLEGCDEDCTLSLCNQTLKNVAISFAGVGSAE